MAKKSMIAREVKRSKLVARYAAKRAEIKAALKQAYKEEQEGGEGAGDAGGRIMDLQAQLRALPRDSSPSRGRRRCRETGRPHGVYRKFGLGRNKLREYAMSGDIPGLTKASW